MAMGVLLGEYIAWHYSVGVGEFVRAWGNIHWFLYNYFSIPTLLRSLFAPFHRIQERRQRGLDFQNIFEVFVVNMLMRIVGAFVRTVIIGIGVVAEIITFAFGILALILFLAAPAVIPASIGFGLTLFIV